ncbi:hypothetical protein [Patulibacter minatonensis]|uniref:hypothetical protein n=1 Tax=Patulibacter minatonensis TaxID=298163 RepID=UPI00047E79AB|nr:hypothetical protein [Patulibacter minatonensis]
MLTVPIALDPTLTHGVVLAERAVGGTEENKSYLVETDWAAVALWIGAPLLLGVLFGWIARRQIFGGTVTAVAAVGFAITWFIAARDDDLQGDTSFDHLADELLSLLIYGGLLLAFGLIGLVGLGAIAGAFLRTAATGERDDDPSDPPSDSPAGPPVRDR